MSKWKKFRNTIAIASFIALVLSLIMDSKKDEEGTADI